MKRLIPAVLMVFFLFSCENKPAENIQNESVQKVKEIPEKDNKTFLAQAKDIAMKSQQALGGQLKAKLDEGGPIHALEFCSLRAIPITDSLSEAHQVKIRRISDKNRNPDNKAGEGELNYIRLVQEKLNKGEIPKPEMVDHADRKTAYFPIMTNAMCLQCHGETGKTMAAETQKRILDLYPDDKATGYGDEQLRGIWVIEMMKQN